MNILSALLIGQVTMLPLPVHSTGTPLHRIRLQRRKILLGHPLGDYNRRTPWSIPEVRLTKVHA